MVFLLRGQVQEPEDRPWQFGVRFCGLGGDDDVSPISGSFQSDYLHDAAASSSDEELKDAKKVP